MDEKQHVTILLVEDDPGHAVLIEKNLRRARIANEIITVNDGQKAIDFLLKKDCCRSDADPVPLLILLDLNLPVLDGYQVLKIIKQDERTKRIPVVVLTTMENPGEMRRCNELGCTVYVTKPVEYGAFSKAIQQLGLPLSIIKAPEKG